MAESNGSAEESNAEARKFTLNLQGFDGKSEVIAQLEASEDTAHPPRLLDISTQALGLSSQGTTPSIAEYETHIILSRGSGHQIALSFFQQAVNPVLDTLDPSRQGRWNLHVTQSETSILELVDQELFSKANNGVKLRIILASGDGGIVDLVNGLSSKPSSSEYIAPQIILLPLGTANALYHSINASSRRQTNTWGLHALSSTHTQPLPIFKVSFSPGARLLVDEARVEEHLPLDANGNGILYGAVVCSWGMHASLVADSDTAEYRKHGIQRFKTAAKEALQPSDRSAPHTYRAKVSVLKNETWIDVQENEFMYVLATLVSHLEAPFCISPASRPLDGRMHLVRFGPKSGEEVMRIMGLVYAGGKHVEDAAVNYEAIDGLRIAFSGMEEKGKWRRICVDGKIVRVEEDGWVEVRKEKRNVVDIVIE